MQLFIEYIRKPEQDRTLLFYAILMLFFYALAYLTVGARAIVVIPNATDVMLQGWAVQWGIYLAFAAFFQVFWVIRIYNKEYFSGRSAWGAFIPLIGLMGYTALLWFAALTHPNTVIHGFVTWITPNLTTYYGIGFTVLAIIGALFYMCLVPLISYLLYMRTRRELGQKVFIKDLSIWVGLLLIFVTIIADFALLFLTPMTLPVIAVRAIMVVGFILLWFGYRLANLFFR